MKSMLGVVATVEYFCAFALVTGQSGLSQGTDRPIDPNTIDATTRSTAKPMFIISHVLSVRPGYI